MNKEDTVTNETLEMAEKYKRHLENKRRSYKRQTKNNPINKEMASVRAMRSVSRKKGHWERVKELDEKYEALKRSRHIE